MIQVPLLSAIFLVLGLGNSWTTAFVVRQKIREKLQQSADFSYKHKYRFTTNGNIDSHTPPSDEKVHDN